jgi:hypothetical protein
MQTLDAEARGRRRDRETATGPESCHE